MPVWVNHLAFAARDLEDLERRKQRPLEQGHDCMLIDHGLTVSLYATDPSGILVEFCATVRPVVTAENRRRAIDLLTAALPPIEGGPLSVQSFAAARRG